MKPLRKFSIITWDGLKNVLARPIDICGVACCVDQRSRGQWVVTHKTTGFGIAKCPKYRDAMKLAKQRIGGLGKNAEKLLVKAAALKLKGKNEQAKSLLRVSSVR